MYKKISNIADINICKQYDIFVTAKVWEKMMNGTLDPAAGETVYARVWNLCFFLENRAREAERNKEENSAVCFQTQIAAEAGKEEVACKAYWNDARGDILISLREEPDRISLRFANRVKKKQK